MKIANFDCNMITSKELVIEQADIKHLKCNTLVNDKLTSINIIVNDLANDKGKITQLESQNIVSKQISSTNIHVVTGDISNLNCANVSSSLIDAKEIETDKLMIKVYI